MQKIQFYYNNSNLVFNTAIVQENDYDLLGECCLFEIVIDGQLFFSEPDFPIFEFWKQLYEWSLKNTCYDFYYNSLETDDNPLISFNNIYTDNMYTYTVNSKWEKFVCLDNFTKKELLKALNPECRTGHKTGHKTGDGSVIES